MLLFNLLYYVLGYVKIELQGSGMEKFMNLAVKNRIIFWDIKRKKGKIELKTPVRNLERLEGIANKTGCELSLLEKRGIPFFLKRIYIRKGFIIGIIFFVTALYYLSNFIWFVEVKGNEKVSNETLFEITESQGLKPGVKKDELDTSKVAQMITAKDDRLVWAGIEIKGMKALVEVVEREEEDREFHGEGHIVAVEDGIVDKVTALSGFSMVSSADEVRKGEILIAGRIVPTEIEEDVSIEDLKEYPMVEARGFILGTMWFENYTEVPLETTRKKRTTNKVDRWGIKFGDEILHLGLQEVPFIEYDKEKIAKKGISENLKPPFSLVKKVYYETEDVEVRKSKEEAREIAKEKLKSELFSDIPPNSRIGEKNFKNLGVEAGKLRMLLQTEVEGNMGVLEGFD